MTLLSNLQSNTSPMSRASSFNLLHWLVIASFFTTLEANTVYGKFTVINKVTKQVMLTFHNVQLRATVPFVKAQLYMALNACSTLDPPNDTNIHSIDGSIPEVSNILLVESSTQCDVNQQLNNSRNAGYSGAIIFCDEIPKDFGILDDTTFYFALLSLSDGLILRKFAKRLYILAFQRDVTLLEKLIDISYAFMNWCSEYVSALKYWMKGFLSPFFGMFKFLVQVIILASPLIFLTVVVNSSRNYEANEEYLYQHFRTEEEEARHWEYYFSNANDSASNEDELLLQRYRDLLGISKGASRSDIEAHFRRNSAPYHPDRNMHASVQERLRKTEQFKEFSAAKIKLLEELEKTPRPEAY